MLDLSNEHEFVDGGATIAYHARVDDGQLAEAESVTNVLRRPIRKEMAAVAEGIVAQAEVVFHIWANRISAQPKARDEIEAADGTRWVVDEVGVEALSSRYRVACSRKR